ncbi:MAG TPA: ParB/RepB/Spo0J family partition protein [Pyrinomonadaceae bacterium]|nr:ParB/RepB/Spo0J family partition protein [Pyrinomonadaceae bacterium]
MTRKALGRGLGALLSAEGAATATEDANEIPIDLIDPSSLQPRSVFDETKLDELAQSITANGVVQPLLLRRHGPRYELIAGERRWRAAQLAGLSKVPAVIRNVPDDKVLELALIENIQREDLNPIEEARAYKKLIDTVGLTQETVAERVGRDRSYVTNYLRLLKLPNDLQELLQRGKISTGHARALLGAEHVEVQRRLARKVIDQDLSVRATEQLVRQTVEPRQKKTRVAQAVDPNVRAAETKLRRQFGTQVRIVTEESGKGRIELEFYNPSDLDRLYSMLTRP